MNVDHFSFVHSFQLHIPVKHLDRDLNLFYSESNAHLFGVVANQMIK